MKTLLESHLKKNQEFFDLLRFTSRIFDTRGNEVNQTIGKNRSQRERSSVDSDGGYKCIHLDTEDFTETLANVIKKEKLRRNISNLKFIDVGMGVGHKVFLANLFGFQSHGLELRKELFKEAGKLLYSVDAYAYNDDARLHHADALKFNRYNEFDVIYFYCPLWDHKLQVKLEQRIARQAKPGAIVVPFLSHYFEREENDKETAALGWCRVAAGRNDSRNYRIHSYWKRGGLTIKQIDVLSRQ